MLLSPLDPLLKLLCPIESLSLASLGPPGLVSYFAFERRPSSPNRDILNHAPADTTIRAVGKRAHPLHNLVSFSSQCVIVATVA